MCQVYASFTWYVKIYVLGESVLNLGANVHLHFVDRDTHGVQAFFDTPEWCSCLYYWRDGKWLRVFMWDCRRKLAPRSYLWSIEKQDLQMKLVSFVQDKKDLPTIGIGTKAKPTSANRVLLQLYPNFSSICCVKKGKAVAMRFPVINRINIFSWVRWWMKGCLRAKLCPAIAEEAYGPYLFKALDSGDVSGWDVHVGKISEA